MTEPLDWTEDGPRSPRFGDVYFSRVDGLAETRAVFLAGCGLPEAWAGRRRFTVAELGFGTGLNILALLDLWRRARPAGGRLSIFSIEGFPIAREDAARALAAWPELADLASVLVSAWPDGRRGLHRIDFPGLGATLDLMIDEAEAALAGWTGRADAWFLDGFAPAKNPGMWTPELMAAVAARSRPGARAATFTVAGAVRRGLEAARFSIEKRPGFGRKRERLEARLPGVAIELAASPRVAVIGGGIAGAALVRAFVDLGLRPVLVEASEPGAGASGNPSALVAPRLDAGLGPVAALHAQAFARATALYRATAPWAILAEGALQLEAGARDAERFRRIAAWDGFARGALQPLGAPEASERLGEPAEGALLIRDALTLDPTPLLQAWNAGAELIDIPMAGFAREAGVWRVRSADGSLLAEAEILCLACGAATAKLLPLPLRITRGQVSVATGVELTGSAAAWGGYAIPAREGILFGATHDRDDWETDMRPADNLRNLESLRRGRPELADRIAGLPLAGRARLRAATPDHLPLAGRVDEGLFVLAGLGGRGFTLAPLLGEEVAALAVGAPPPLPPPLAAIVDPARYKLRA